MRWRRIINDCVMNWWGYNLLCAHPTSISKENNYQTRILKILEDSSLDEYQKEEIFSKLENIFRLISNIDQLVRFSKSWWLLWEVKKTIFWEVLNPEIYTIISSLEKIISQNKLLIANKPQNEKWSLLNFSERQKFQKLLVEAQKLIRIEYEKLLSPLWVKISS